MQIEWWRIAGVGLGIGLGGLLVLAHWLEFRARRAANARARPGARQLDASASGWVADLPAPRTQAVRVADLPEGVLTLNEWRRSSGVAQEVAAAIEARQQLAAQLAVGSVRALMSREQAPAGIDRSKYDADVVQGMRRWAQRLGREA